MTETITLRNLAARATPGPWVKGKTTHHTVTDKGYHIAEWHHADDAALMDALYPQKVIDLLNKIDSLRAALAQQAEPMKEELHGCACRWDADDNRVATCVRHQGWLDVVQEWSERAKAAEAPQVAQQAEQGWVRVPVEPTAEMINAYASVPYDEGSIASECRSGWRAMLAAAPKGGV